LHVIVSVLNTFHGIVVHSFLFILIAWLLFRPEAAPTSAGISIARSRSLRHSRSALQRTQFGHH